MGYLGSKAASGAYQAIISQMPPHDTYIETHLGSGAIFKAKQPSSSSIGIDIDPDPIASFVKPYPASLINMDCVNYLNCFDFNAAGRVLVYSDPPYLHITRASKSRYRFEYTDDDHVRLLECLKSIPASVIISGYPSQLYDELLGDWRSLEFQVMTRGGPRTEKLWMNYDCEKNHWASFAGLNYIDRQRIKRKAERWAANYQKLPAGEQLSILSSILATHIQNA